MADNGKGKDNFWVGNHIRDVYDKPDGVTDFENHGVYIDGDGSYEVAYNLIDNIVGGNGIQAHSTSGGQINNVSIHHHIIYGVGKHGINLSSGSAKNFMIYQNIVHGSDMAGIRLDAGKRRSAKVFNNTFFDTDRLDIGNPRAAVMNDAIIETVSLEFKNNIAVPGNERRAFLGGSVGLEAAVSSASHNLWYLGKS